MVMPLEAPARAPRPRRRVSVLGATGSVGQSTIDLLTRNRDAYEIVALTAGRNVEALAAMSRALQPELAVIADASLYDRLQEALAGTGIEVAAGDEAIVDAARRDADWVMAAIVGAAGLASTFAAADRGATVALANKESLVAGGALLNAAIERGGGRLLPVDSEHSAIFQVLEPANAAIVEKLILTASGGPFRDWTREAMKAATPAAALAHPNWDMGAKITIDSATMMNKGFELIEAHHLFDMPAARLEVLVHPQSIVHSLVAYRDGSMLAQLGMPDMRTPIAVALAWPERMETPTEILDLAAIGRLDFETPDEDRFPALRLAREALAAGPAASLALNAANEIAVAAFLAGQLGFLAIAETVERCLEAMEAAGELVSPGAVGEILELDRLVRDRTAEILEKSA